MASVRPAAVSGSFYPAGAAELSTQIDRLLAEAGPGEPAKAIVAPHAGYIYSGPIAASAFHRLPRQARRVVLLGPSHFVPLRGVAVPRADLFETPLGRVALEAPYGVARSDLAHAQEHSLEVEVPFLQRLLGEFRLVALAVGDAAPQQVADVVGELWGGPETAVVVSTDLSHYLPYEIAQTLDEETARRIENLQAVEDGAACGAAPLNGLLFEAARRGMRCERLDLRNSGDTAGDRRRVVGYGAFALREVM